jgi:hypothetical protein
VDVSFRYAKANVHKRRMPATPDSNRALPYLPASTRSRKSDRMRAVAPQIMCSPTS